MKQLITPRHYTAWQLIKLYWQSEERFYAYLLFGIVVVMTMCLVGFDVLFSFWSNYFYTALQEYDKRGTIRLFLVFCVLAAFFIAFSVYRYYLSQLFGLRWRRWLTKQFINRWLMRRDFYYLENFVERFDERTDNPDQRLQEDVGALVTGSISLSLGFIASVTTVIGFVIVLWNLSGVIHLSLGRFGEWTIPGYLVWVAVLYAIVGTYITFKIGYPLISLNFEQQQREANFRFAAIDLRSHAENVALYHGEHHQKGILYRLFGGVLDNWYMIILRQRLLLWFTGGYNQTAVILPLLVALPNYFNRVFMLGGVMQSMRAFNSIQDALSFFVNAYTQIAEYRAVIRRLTTFLNHMQAIDEKVSRHDHLISHKENGKMIKAHQLTIMTPREEILLKNINEELIHGHHYLIQGPSGIGKSTFVRALAGLWPFAEGEIVLPSHQKIMFLPQKPYMPIGTLAEAILFPDKDYAPFIVDHRHKMKTTALLRESQYEIQVADQATAAGGIILHDDAKLALLEKILSACHLENLIPRLQETAAWSQQLSPGEQQRVAFARVLLQKPDWAFLDETTSMVDLKTEQALYEQLKTQLPHCSIVSVGHRPSLSAFHDQVIDMAKYSGSDA